MIPAAYAGGLRICSSDIIGLINVTETGLDVLRLHELATTHNQGPHAVNEKGGYNAHLDAVLSGRDDRCREAIAKMLETAWDPELMLDQASARILLHAGVDPATACAIALLVDAPVTIERDWSTPVIVKAHEGACEPVCTVAGSLSSQVSWNSEHGIRLSGMPEALISAAHGHPLSDYVSHPAFDGLRLVLHDSHELYGHTWIGVSGMETLSASDLLAMRPSYGA